MEKPLWLMECYHMPQQSWAETKGWKILCLTGSLLLCKSHVVIGQRCPVGELLVLIEIPSSPLSCNVPILHILCASMQMALDRDHLWRVAVRLPEPPCLTHKVGSTWEFVSAGGSITNNWLVSEAQIPLAWDKTNWGGTIYAPELPMGSDWVWDLALKSYSYLASALFSPLPSLPYWFLLGPLL